MSMLAITPTTAYRICAYNEGDNCTDYCPGGYILNTSGNRCNTSCSYGEYKLIPDGICIDKCDPSIFVVEDQLCGLCKDFDSNKIFKFINGTNCLSDIPDGAELYNEDLSILKCMEGYHYQNDYCIKCYNTCKDCNESSKEENNQKCIKCKDDLLLEDGNCLSQCSSGYKKIGNECINCYDNTCKNFSNNSCNCLECNDGYYLILNKCSECDPSCKTCNNNKNECTSCFNNSFLSENKCVYCSDCNETEKDSCKCASCNEGLYLENFLCKNCSDNCRICDNNTECTFCNNGYYLDKGICLSQCSNGYELIGNECKFCNNDYNKCETFITNSCGCSKCKNTYYLNETKCLKCDFNCYTCINNANECSSCYDNKFLFIISV